MNYSGHEEDKRNLVIILEKLLESSSVLVNYIMVKILEKWFGLIHGFLILF